MRVKFGAGDQDKSCKCDDPLTQRMRHLDGQRLRWNRRRHHQAADAAQFDADLAITIVGAGRRLFGSVAVAENAL